MTPSRRPSATRVETHSPTSFIAFRGPPVRSQFRIPSLTPSQQAPSHRLTATARIADTVETAALVGAARWRRHLPAFDVSPRHIIAALSLSIGGRVGPYEVVAKLGEGAMGEVYRGRDSKLARDVALKILPAAVAADVERVSRFEREAKTLAALNHPHIAQIYGFEQSNNVSALVLELVEGEDLAQRIARGAIPLEEALAIARQIADALEAAHDAGIIHRDLKPANIKVRADSTVKVLDFGLAKARGTVGAGKAGRDDLLDSRTMTSPTITSAGIILGTAAYMSPEQAAGKTADQRADIWAFGVVLYEMLTGTRPFDGGSVSETIASVMKSEPDWSALSAPSLQSVRTVLGACLEKEPRRRLRNIGDVRLLLDRRLDVATPVARTSRSSSGIHVAWALALVAGTALAFWFAATRQSPTELPLRRFELKLPAAAGSAATQARISPDGSRVAYIGASRLWIHDLGTLEAREVPGTNDAFGPFWSSDSQWIAFGSGRRLWKAPASGGAPVAIADLQEQFSPAAGGAWYPDGRIIFTTGFSGLLEVSDRGGDVRVALAVDPNTDLDFHEAAPLPDNRGVLFYVHGRPGSPTGIAVFDGKDRKMVLQERALVLDHPAYSPTGHLLYRRSPTNAGIWAIPFSIDTLATNGDPFVVVPGQYMPSVSDDGTLIYAQGGSGLAQPARLTWVDRSGAIVGSVGDVEPGLQAPVLSPDGSRVAVATTDGAIWVYDAARGTRVRVMVEPGLNMDPAWMPDDNQLVHVAAPSWDAGEPRLVLRSVDGSLSSSTLVDGQKPHVSADGRHLVYQTFGGGGRTDIMRVDLQQRSAPVPVVNDPNAAEQQPMLSPDGRWLAYTSDVSGRNEVYVTSVPDAQRRWQLSTGGGVSPRWRADGREFFYMVGDTLMAVTVGHDPTFSAGRPTTLFRADRLSAGFDVTRDGKRFLTVRNEDDRTVRTVTVVQNWFAAFRQVAR